MSYLDLKHYLSPCIINCSDIFVLFALPKQLDYFLTLCVLCFARALQSILKSECAKVQPYYVARTTFRQRLSLTRPSPLFAVEKSRPGNFSHQKVRYTAVFIIGRDTYNIAILSEAYNRNYFKQPCVRLSQGCTTCARKRIFCDRAIVLQNARCGGRALIKMFCYVTVKK